MHVLGVDQSMTMTGLASVREGVIRTARVSSGPVEGEQLAAACSRIRYIAGQVLKFAPARCMSVIEAPIVMRNGKGGMQLERAWLFGILVDQLMLRGPVVQVRTKTRAKYATGNGNAEKPEVLAAIRATFPDVLVADDNVADGLALLGMGARWMGSPIDGELSEKQMSAMSAVVWPDTKWRTE